MAETVRFTCAGRTDVGIVRSGNEDAFLMLPEAGVFIVADGMGGHAAGEVASQMAVTIVGQALGDVAGQPDSDAADVIRESLVEANGAIFERTLVEQDKRGMGTTATAMVINGRRYLVGQVGDSRAYVHRGEQLLQITKDHSYVQEQVDSGYLTAEQARTHPYSNVITRCVGANAEVAPDIYGGTLHAGDVFLLASDGLTGMLEDEDLMSILRSGDSPGELVDHLISEANRRGGLDNITVIVVRIDGIDRADNGATASPE
ncbi:MAG: Stp1/IreP family PP2C-type Ser/Thr phosphatase [Gemmatimonadota bacterium]|nr:Stp1/IreP family PP2C-type Ser/Thr phosphatase [Gemmatimonadota bacterium]